MKLPKAIRQHEKASSIEAYLEHDSKELWQQGTIKVCHQNLTNGLRQGLLLAKGSGHLLFGLDKIKDHYKKNPLNSESYQNLLILSSEGSERFYRGAESLLKRNPALLGLRLDTSPKDLGLLLFEKEKELKAVLVPNTNTMAKILFFAISAS